MKHFLFSIVLGLLVLVVIAGMFYMALPMLESRYEEKIVAHLAGQMTEEQKKHYYETLVRDMAGFWEPVPEADVARVGQANTQQISHQAEVQINNAGMRSEKDYGPKPSNTYRIVCLGDSFVFGEAGKEQDRFCNQIEDFYHAENIKVDGKQIETLAVGLGSWTTVQEMAYMKSRLSAYDPDLIIVLSTENDITSSSAVNGKGFLTGAFSPEFRDMGTGIYRNVQGAEFGYNNYNLLSWNLSPLSDQLWRRSTAYMKELTGLQHRRGKKIIFSVLDVVKNYSRNYLDHYYQADIDAPVFFANYMRNKHTTLPHDSHPNRRGHRIMANHYIHVLNKLGWIEVKNLPKLNKNLSMDINPELDKEELVAIKQKMVDKTLRETIVFGEFDAMTIKAILGGIFPQSREGKRRDLIWSANQSAFLMKSPLNTSSNDKPNFEMEIDLPARAELYPMTLTLTVNGKQQRFRFTPADVGTQTLRLEQVPLNNEFGVVEVILQSDTHFTTITDHRMKSVALVKATLL